MKEGQKFERDKITDILAAFHIFDAQNRGYIESRDLREALGLTVKDIRCDELRQMLKETGLLVDRKITFAGNDTKAFVTLKTRSNLGRVAPLLGTKWRPA